MGKERSSNALYGSLARKHSTHSDTVLGISALLSSTVAHGGTARDFCDVSKPRSERKSLNLKTQTEN